MSGRTISRSQQAQAAGEQTAVAIARERLPWHPEIGNRFGIDRAQWRALVEAVFPAARTVEGVLLALSYCKARNLDPMKKPIHIIPIWDAQERREKESVWPGIGEHRITAHRSGSYAGCDDCEFGPEQTMDFIGTVGRDGNQRQERFTISFPTWARMIVYKMVRDQRVAINGPRVYWMETYARMGRSDLPNEMWRKRPYGQIEKCAEAAALRRAFPEEIGNELTAEEMGGDEPVITIDTMADVQTRSKEASRQAPPRKPQNEPASPPQQTQSLARQPDPEPPQGSGGLFDGEDGFSAFIVIPGPNDTAIETTPEPFADPVAWTRAMLAECDRNDDPGAVYEINSDAALDAGDASDEAKALINAWWDRREAANKASEQAHQQELDPNQGSLLPEDQADAVLTLDQRARTFMDGLSAIQNLQEVVAWRNRADVHAFGNELSAAKRTDLIEQLRAAWAKRNAELMNPSSA